MAVLVGAFSLSALGLLHTAVAQTQDKTTENFYIKDGDRVVFYGDSITNQRQYTAFAETFVLTRFPERDVRFVHSGWSGDRVGGGRGGNVNTRLQRDVFAWDPTVVTIMLGMNDGFYRAFDQNIFSTYRNGLTSIVKKLETELPDARITLIRPSPYDDVTRAPNFTGGYNEVLIRYGDAVEELAKANNHQVADLNADLLEVLKKSKAENADLSTKIISDRVHPEPAGHLIMAGSLLKAWGAPSLVSAVAIDARPAKGNPRVVSAENATVTDLQNRDGSLLWTQLDKALPMPINFGDAAMALVVESSDFIENLNQQMLRVAGLNAPFYTLKIDGQQIGTYTSAQLFDGVNLAILETPMLKQAEKVHELTVRRANTHQTRWRTIQVPFSSATESKELKEAVPMILAAFDAEVEAIRQLQRTAAQPVAHRFELIPQEKLFSTFGTAEPLLPEGSGPNLALNKRWVSSSKNNRGWDSGLTDGSWLAGNKTTYATENDKTFPKAVTVDLEKPQTLASIIAGVPPFGSTKTVAVSLSEDGTNFREVGRHVFQIKQEEKHLFRFEPVNARYIRLTFEDHYPDRAGYDPAFMFITDLQAYGKAGD